MPTPPGLPPRPLRDLRNRSYRNQDLTGADFSYTDLRGCDFTGATLVGANFQGCRTGQSRRQIIICIAVTIAVAVADVVAFAFVIAIIAIAAFSQGKILEGIGLTLIAVILAGFAIYSFLELVKMLRNATGTSFKEANLSQANFSNSVLKNTDFADSISYLVQWKNAAFARCKLWPVFESQAALHLCASRDGRRQDYTNEHFKHLDLTGVDLTAATLVHANFNQANLHHAILENTNLSHAQALGTDFSEANLTGACIQNWGINADTKFTHVRCGYIYLEPNQQERKPASGTFQPGDFEKLVHQFTKTLDFLFRNGIDPQAFDFALHNLLTEYEEAGLSMHSVIDVGEGDRLVRFNVANPEADKGAMHAQVLQDYETMHQQLEAERAEKYALREQVAKLDGQLTVYQEQSIFLQGFVYHQTDRFSRPSLHAPNSHFLGDPMADKGNKLEIGSIGGDASGIAGGDSSGVAGKNITGAAGGDISGTLTVTMGQLEDSTDPQAMKLAELLKQVKTAVERPDAGLSETDRQKALKHLEAIATLGRDRQNPDLLEKAGDALDALPTILKRGNNLVEFAEKYLPTFTAGVRAIFGAWGLPL